MHEPHSPHESAAPVAYWEDRYAGDGPVWSGAPNATLVDVLGGLAPGRALDLGCGEGGDAVWLAAQGWTVTGIDIAPTAIARARAAAAAAGLSGDRIRFLAADLAAVAHDEQFDLVTASFFHSTVELPRTDILRRAAERVAPGGHLFLLTHAARPPWATAEVHDHHFLRPDEELDELQLDTAQWLPVRVETVNREISAPDGGAAVLEDGVVLLKRL
jgi:2-polyprenyl-3-methyl-5-hydroxy-6-metoxy-1,4-benzoquinol methylase